MSIHSYRIGYSCVRISFEVCECVPLKLVDLLERPICY